MAPLYPSRNPLHWSRLRAAGTPPDGILNLFGVTGPAVPVMAMAEEMGVKVVSLPGSDFSGQIDVDDDGVGAMITVNRTESAQRQRFTVAHELGHLFLHKEKRHHRDMRFSGFDKSEVEANQFAADLIMPGWMLWRAASDYPTVPSLARLFDVSEYAMEYRVKTLKIWTVK